MIYITIQSDDNFEEYFVADKSIERVRQLLTNLTVERVADELNAEIIDGPNTNDYGFICEDFESDGSCIHSDHMSLAGM